MPLRNRVTPFGEIVASPGRGSMMGNRGILHDDDRRVVRTFAVRRWIACRLEFRGRRRRVMTPHRPAQGEVDVLTPRSVVAVLAAGYRPSLHPTLSRPSS